MIDDLAKALVFGFVGAKAGKAAEAHMDARQRERDEAIQKLKQTAFVIYDGEAPYTAAQSLTQYLRDLGYQAAAITPEVYHDRLEGTSAEEYARWIIIGHHDFTKERMARVSLRFDGYGLKMGVKDGWYVLRARRADLSPGKKGRKAFAAYYNQEMLSYRDLAERYGVPMTFGARGETRESQYDLLWLKCARSFREELDMERMGAVLGNLSSHRT